MAWLGKREWQSLDARLTTLFPVLVDIQLLLGLVLYLFVSPLTTGALRDFGAAMSNAVTRFYTVEHTLMMLIVLGAAHIGRALIKKRSAAAARFRSGALIFGLALIVILLATPWPFLAAGTGRPWFRLG